VEALERNAILRQSLDCIRAYAAEAGDADSFRLASEIVQHYPDPHPSTGVLSRADSLTLDLLVRRGEFDRALESVENASPAQKRLYALSHVMDQIAKGSKLTPDDILANCYR
jgi:hypothetical protein